jgi:hypothetical protein
LHSKAPQGQLPLLTLACVAVGIVFVFLNLDNMWGTSVDVGHHYSLVARIAQEWAFPSGDPSLGEMNVYPPGSHLLSAVLGQFVDSPFLGMQLVALISLLVLWTSIAMLLRGLSPVVAASALLLMIAVVLANHFGPRFDLHGQELIGNFFLSQIAGHALLYASMLMSVGVERRFGVRAAVAVLGALLLVVASVHLLPSIEMLGLMWGLLATYVVIAPPPNSKPRARWGFALPFGIVVTAALWFHPAFSAMREISENNGWLFLGNISYPEGLIALAGATLAISAVGYFVWWRDPARTANLVLKYFALYGGASAALCMLQLVLNQFGYGSDYAAKKYGFGLATVFVIQAAILAGYLAARFFQRSVLQQAGKLAGGFALFLLIAAVFTTATGRKVTDVSLAVRFERELVTLIETQLPKGELDNIIVGLRGLAPPVSYGFSTALMRSARPGSEDAINGTIEEPERFGYIVSSQDNPVYGRMSCAVPTGRMFAVLTGDCVAEQMVVLRECRTPRDFTSDGHVLRELTNGWGVAEPHGQWMNRQASFSCTNTGQQLSRATIAIAPFLFGELKSQRLRLRVNGLSAGEFVLSAPTTITVDLPDVTSPQSYTIEFEAPDAKSPKALGMNDDGRRLGFSLSSLTLE